MSKITGFIVVWAVAFVLLLPMLIMGYGMVFGHVYTANQTQAGGIMALVGASVAVFGSVIVGSNLND